MATRCYLGRLHDDGRHVTVVPVRDGAHPDTMLDLLRRLLHLSFDGDHQQMSRRLLIHGWIRLDPDAVDVGDAPDQVTVDGVGATLPDAPPPTRRDVTRDSLTNRAVWLYILHEREPAVTVYEATVHGRFAHHSYHRLFHPAHRVASMIGVVGDPADGHREHQWRPAIISLDGLPTAFSAEICTVEHARGVIVARLEHGELRNLIDVTDAFYRHQRPGSGIPYLVLVAGVLIVSWYADTPHGQTQQIMPDVAARYIVASHVLPWILTQEPTPGNQPGELRNGVPPIREWVTEAGVHACHPILAGYRLPQIAAALSALGGDVPGVMAGVDGVHVWVIAASHALMLTATDTDTGTGTVILPRPLGGSWYQDRPVPIFTAEVVAAACARPPRPDPPS